MTIEEICEQLKSIKVRHEIYKKALQLYVTNHREFGSFMCNAIYGAVQQHFGVHVIYLNCRDRNKYITYCKEFLKHKPKRTNGRVWFSMSDKQIRIDILNKCIEKTTQFKSE